MRRELVERAIAGDRDAYAELARTLIGRLYAVAFLILRHGTNMIVKRRPSGPGEVQPGR